LHQRLGLLEILDVAADQEVEAPRQRQALAECAAIGALVALGDLDLEVAPAFGRGLVGRPTAEIAGDPVVEGIGQ
jgi:hypothetical protein